MKETRILMDMPITVDIIGGLDTQHAIEKVFSYFISIDEKFSTFKPTSEISAINRGERKKSEYSSDMNVVLALCEKTKKETQGFFDIERDYGIDPSGIVKGWAIYQASLLVADMGYENFFIDAGGDIQTKGKNEMGNPWKVGIRNPFNRNEIVKMVVVGNGGIATSGTYIRGQHIYNPHKRNEALNDIVSFTVIGPNIYEADRFATPAFAMGKRGIHFIEELDGFEGYMIDSHGIATYTSGFNSFVSV